VILGVLSIFGTGSALLLRWGQSILQLGVGGTAIVGLLLLWGGKERLSALVAVSACVDYFAGSSDVRSEYVLPLKVEGRVIGALNCEHRIPEAFPSEVRTLLGRVARPPRDRLERPLFVRSSFGGATLPPGPRPGECEGDRKRLGSSSP